MRSEALGRTGRPASAASVADDQGEPCPDAFVGPRNEAPRTLGGAISTAYLKIASRNSSRWRQATLIFSRSSSLQSRL